MILSKLSVDTLIRSRHNSHHPALRKAVGLAITMALVLLMASLLPLSTLPPAVFLSAHTLLEVFSIVVASLVFAVGWETHRRKQSANLLVLACLFLGVALLDISHTLTFPGNPGLLVPAHIDNTIIYWLSARLLAALALLWMAIRAPWNDVAQVPNRWALLLGVLAAVSALHAVLYFFPEALPATFYPHSGLTPFKVGFEYFLVTLNLVAAFLLWRAMRGPLSFNAASLFGAVCAMALSEFCLTLYSVTNDTMSLLGHLLKVASYLFLFRAVFIETVERPFAALQASQQRLQAIFDALPDILVEVNKSGKVMEFHAPHSDELDLSRRQMVGREMVPLLPPEAIPICERTFIEAKQRGHAQSEPFRSRIDGRTVWFQISAAPKQGADGHHYLVIARDVTKTKEQESEILRLSQHDSVTHLPNRKLFIQRTEMTLRLTARNQGSFALMQINLDGFKQINLAHGHQAGDQLLAALADRLRAILREEDVLSRESGDQFILTLPALDSVAAAHVAERLCHSIARPLSFGEHIAPLTASIGIAIYPDDGSTLDELTRRAAAALQLAKQDGGNTYRFLSEDLQARMAHILQLENLLRDAEEHLELSLRYQPQWELGNRHLAGLHASLRWLNAELGEISVEEFQPIAEASGQALALNDWVLQQVLAQLKRWQDEGLTPVPVAVSLCPAKFRMDNLPARIRKSLEAWSIEPRYLQLEIPEDLAMEDPAATAIKLKSLRELGVSIVIGNFGDCYSSLQQMQSFQPDIVKIDRLFISEPTASNREIILGSLIDIAHRLGLKTMVEGVYTREQLALVQRNGCDYVQGDQLNPPLAPEEASRLLIEARTERP
ncbi:putative bifunctional diguanylate cyclase/phosphodiesterase [Pseudomonas profundi]|uniref:putative bifunctional diguanylate cyclase/phosphodiesterase n=1 Tax=Pseudomonas profundi TaxID=1981513 RepID=UPI001680DF57|nr:MASE3 domain-containing protein [Pseudomonas profundi]